MTSFRILVVDDKQTMLSLFKRILTGHEVTTVSDGIQALSLFSGGEARWGLSIFSILVSIALGWWALKSQRRLLISAIGAMEGPAFEPFSTPLVEVVVFAAIGAVIGVGFGWLRLRLR